MPKRGWGIAKGLFTGSPPISVELIKAVRTSDESTFNADDLPDRTVFT
jgi:hypothetical protein